MPLDDNPLEGKVRDIANPTLNDMNPHLMRIAMNEIIDEINNHSAILVEMNKSLTYIIDILFKANIITRNEDDGKIVMVDDHF